MTTVFLVDDDQADLDILQMAFGTIGGSAVEASTSVDDAVGRIVDLQQSDDVVVITDLNMPVKSGLDLLVELRTQCEVPPVMLVLTTSDRRIDVDRAYTAGANGFHTKPMGYGDTIELCRDIHAYWMGSARRPQPRPQFG